MKRANAYLVVAIFLLAFFCLVVESYDASEIPTDQKRQWCQQQVASCPLICADQGEKNTAEKNICVVRTLEYECVCNNGFQPNASEYTQTIPYFTCSQEVEDCKENCNSDANCIDGCNRECGVKNPPKREEEEGDTAGDDNEGNVIEDGEPTETDDDSGDDDDSADLYSKAALTSINGSFAIFLAVALAFSVRL